MKKVIATSIILITFSILILYSIIYYYRIYFPGDFSDNHTRWAEFGSYFGGLAGPILSFTSIVFIIITILVQYYQIKINLQQIEENKYQIEKNNFEKIYFELITLISNNTKNNNEILDNVFVNKLEKYHLSLSNDIIDISNLRVNLFERITESEKIIVEKNCEQLLYLISYVKNSNLKTKKDYYELITAFIGDKPMMLCVYYSLVVSKFNIINSFIVNSNFNLKLNKYKSFNDICN